MTISHDLSAPLIVVVGATGTQGGSVINNLDASDKQYRMRGLTRDISKTSAKKLAERRVEMVSCDIRVGEEERVQKVFQGATYIFAVTNYWEHVDKAREIAEGKLMVDAAKTVGVELFIWSSEPSVTKASKGTVTKVSHFDSKAEVSEYARSAGIRVVDVHVGGYMNNFTTFSKPRPAGDGSYMIASTWNPTARMPLIDTFHDAGLFVRQAIESEEFNSGDGRVIGAYGEWVSIEDQMEILTEATGKRIRYLQLTDEQMAAGMKEEGMPQHVIDDMLGMFRFHDGIWEDTYLHSNRGTLARAPRTFKEYCELEHWDGVFT
ncbi:hypothetical protein LTR78_010307 [Recurvomyces mirabilis]|uniref:NmrA-like domain-containing protein n=1 Tax=Recurvomyces mirabilis TaxID=574656 RepID=A0AAE0WI20_9PEZI|nr:hypothetical protein LTR78_010307 [Recurvomyces mirabilis]KAK5149879.1 hypothetical protein LTS14_010594 [Recurvomyces mirabilis]